MERYNEHTLTLPLYVTLLAPLSVAYALEGLLIKIRADAPARRRGERVGHGWWGSRAGKDVVALGGKLLVALKLGLAVRFEQR